MNAADRPPLVPVLAWSASQHALSMLQVFVVPAIAPAMAAGLGVTESLVGVQVMLVYVTATIASLYAGSLVVRLGAVRATQLSIATGAAGLALSAIPSLPVIVLASVLLGLGYGLINPATGQMLEAAVSPERRAFAFSLKQSALPLGGVLAGLTAPGLALALGWQRRTQPSACVCAGSPRLAQLPCPPPRQPAACRHTAAPQCGRQLGCHPPLPPSAGLQESRQRAHPPAPRGGG
jgi:MFS family permease